MIIHHLRLHPLCQIKFTKQGKSVRRFQNHPKLTVFAIINTWLGFTAIIFQQYKNKQTFLNHSFVLISIIYWLIALTSKAIKWEITLLFLSRFYFQLFSVVSMLAKVLKINNIIYYLGIYCLAGEGKINNIIYYLRIYCLAGEGKYLESFKSRSDFENYYFLLFQWSRYVFIWTKSKMSTA